MPRKSTLLRRSVGALSSNRCLRAVSRNSTVVVTADIDGSTVSESQLQATRPHELIESGVDCKPKEKAMQAVCQESMAGLADSTAAGLRRNWEKLLELHKIRQECLSIHHGCLNSGSCFATAVTHQVNSG